MLVYFINLFIVVLAAFLARKSKSVILSRLLLGVAFTSMVLVAGLRDRSVGTDTGDYVSYFNKVKTLEDVDTVGKKMGEYGFWVMIWLIHFISNEYITFFFTIAIIVVICYQRSIVAHSDAIEISFFVYIAMGIYSFCLNGARQGIACAIYALALSPLLERKFIKYCIYVFLAYLFHKTAIMMLPVYFIFNKANTFRINLIIVLVGLTSAVFYENILAFASSIDTRYEAYGAVGRGGGYFMIGFTSVLGIFFFLFKKSIHIDRAQYDRFLNMYLFGMMISVVSMVLSTNPSGLLRYSLYFNVAAVFLWPIVFKNIPDRLSRFVVGYIFVIGYLVFYMMTTTAWSNLIPYKFNPSLLF